MKIKFIIMAAGILLLLSIAWWIVSSLAERKAQLAIAEQTEKLARKADEENKKLQDSFEKERKASQLVLESLTSRQEDLERRLTERSRQTAVRLQEVSQPKPKEEIAQDSQVVLGFQPPIQGQQFLLTAPQLQSLNALRLEADRLAADLRDREQQLILEKERTRNLQALLEKSETLIISQNALIENYKNAMEGYKAVAKKTKLQKIVAVGKQGAFVLVAGLIVRSISK